jgi:CBS domain containing-hemolysin-like protein
MSLLPWVAAGGGTLLAALSAMADGAVLAAGWRSAALPATVAPASGSDHTQAGRRERTHRALAVVRVAGLVVAGVGSASALHLATLAPLQRGLWLLAIGAVVVTLVEGVARAFGDTLGDAATPLLRGWVRLVEAVCAPVTRVGDAMERGLLEVAPDTGGSSERREQAAAQFRDVVTAEPDVTREERSLLLGVFSFGETTAEEVMVPRVDIVGIERDTPWSEVVDRIRSERHSRMPVFDTTLDEVVGILYAKDLLGAVVAGEEPAGGWQSLVRPVAFIPASKRIADLLREFRATRRHIAIVADEYGGTAGLVTIEDVLEELVGEIRDEYDDEERQVEVEEGVRFWVSGRLTLDDLSDAVGVDLRRDDVSTVGGLILELLGRVPRAGETLRIGPFRVVVERVVRRKVARVFLERMAEPEAGAPPDGTHA